MDIFDSDPYAIIKIYQCLKPLEVRERRKLLTSFRSLTVDNTLNPTWSQSFCVPLGVSERKLQLDKEKGGALEVQIFDEDSGKRDDFLGCTDSPILTETLSILLIDRKTKIHA